MEYRIPIKGLSNGIHQYDYQINGVFLQQFEHSPIRDAQINMQMMLDKRAGMYTLDFSFSGTVRSTCDRCLADINLPVQGENRLLVKLSHETESEDPDVAFIHPDAQKLEVAEFIYEFIILAIPMIKVYDCEEEEPYPCNDEMLDRLEGEDIEEDTNDEESTNPIWEELKKFNSKK